MYINCPECGFNNDVTDCLPDAACDDIEHECHKCEHEFKIGWTAEVELR